MHHGNGSEVAGAHTGGFWITVCFLSTHPPAGGWGKGLERSLEGASSSLCGEGAVGVAPSQRCSPNRPAARPPACVPGDRFINTRRCRGGSQQQRRLSRRPASLCNCWELRSPGGLPHPGLGHPHEHLRGGSPRVPPSDELDTAPSLGRGLGDNFQSRGTLKTEQALPSLSLQYPRLSLDHSEGEKSPVLCGTSGCRS